MRASRIIVLVLGVILSPLVPRVLDLSGAAAGEATVVAVILAVDLASRLRRVDRLAGDAVAGARRLDLAFVANAAQVAVVLPLTFLLAPTYGLTGAAVAEI